MPCRLVGVARLWEVLLVVYLLVALVAIGCVTIAEHAQGLASRVRDALWVVAFVVLLVPAALRYDIGVDYSATMESAGYLGYWQLYHLYATQPPALGMDPGFYLLIRVLNLFTDNPQWMFATLSATTYALVLRACRRISPAPALSVALFVVAGFYFESYNIARQWFAIACVMNGLAWAGAKDKEDPGTHPGLHAFAHYALWVLLGASMHLSCLLWLALWPLLRVRMTPRRAVGAFVVLLVVAFAGVHVAQLLFSGTRFGLYLDPASSVYVGPAPRLNAIITSGITWAFALVAGRLSGQRIWAGLSSALIVCATLAFALDVSSTFLPFIIDRVARYFAPMLILLMPMALDWLPAGRLRRSCAAIVLVAWIAATYVQVIAGGQYGVVPYQSVFDERAVEGILS